jgi:hypothetical protein
MSRIQSFGFAHAWRLLGLAPALAVAWGVAAAAPVAVPGAWSLEVEGSVAFNTVNDVRAPGTTGTRFSLTDDLDTDPTRCMRLRLGYDASGRHHLSALVAPLRIVANGALDVPIRFQDVEYAAGTPLEARYRFDSYRVTYCYDAYIRGPWRVGVGLTAKIRDAEIALDGADTKVKTTNTGFVPLVHFLVAWTPRPALQLLCEGDALAGPHGRAEDVFVGLGYLVQPQFTLKAGYRILEGGADVDSIYNFALVHYLSLGGVIRL